MYSDEWLRLGYQVRDDIVVARDGAGTLIHYKHWVDAQGGLVGVRVSFEYAEDYHVEFIADDWTKLLVALDSGAGPKAETAALEGYFTTHTGMDLQRLLDAHGIRRTGISFVDWSRFGD